MTIEDWKTSAAAVADGLLPFQAQFVAAVCGKEQPPEIAAPILPAWERQKLACRGDGGAVTDAGRSAVRTGR